MVDVSLGRRRRDLYRPGPTKRGCSQTWLLTKPGSSLNLAAQRKKTLNLAVQRKGVSVPYLSSCPNLIIS